MNPEPFFSAVEKSSRKRAASSPSPVKNGKPNLKNPSRSSGRNLRSHKNRPPKFTKVEDLEVENSSQMEDSEEKIETDSAVPHPSGLVSKLILAFEGGIVPKFAQGISKKSKNPNSNRRQPTTREEMDIYKLIPSTKGEGEGRKLSIDDSGNEIATAKEPNQIGNGMDIVISENAIADEEVSEFSVNQK